MGLTYASTQDKLAHHFHRPMLGTMTHRMNSKTIPAEHESVFRQRSWLVGVKGASDWSSRVQAVFQERGVKPSFPRKAERIFLIELIP